MTPDPVTEQELQEIEERAAKVTININNTARVKLTDDGANIVRAFCKSDPGAFVRHAVAGAVFTDQLWRIMEIFGPHIHFATEPPFETTFEIDVDHVAADVPRLCASLRAERAANAKMEERIKLLERYAANAGVGGLASDAPEEMWVMAMFYPSCDRWLHIERAYLENGKLPPEMQKRVDDQGASGPVRYVRADVAEAANAKMRDILNELVTLKDWKDAGLNPSEYAVRKPLAWAHARAALAPSPANEGRATDATAQGVAALYGKIPAEESDEEFMDAIMQPANTSDLHQRIMAMNKDGPYISDIGYAYNHGFNDGLRAAAELVAGATPERNSNG